MAISYCWGLVLTCKLIMAYSRKNEKMQIQKKYQKTFLTSSILCFKVKQSTPSRPVHISFSSSALVPLYKVSFRYNIWTKIFGKKKRIFEHEKLPAMELYRHPFLKHPKNNKNKFGNYTLIQLSEAALSLHCRWRFSGLDMD